MNGTKGTIRDWLKQMRKFIVKRKQKKKEQIELNKKKQIEERKRQSFFHPPVEDKLIEKKTKQETLANVTKLIVFPGVLILGTLHNDKPLKVQKITIIKEKKASVEDKVNTTTSKEVSIDFLLETKLTLKEIDVKAIKKELEQKKEGIILDKTEISHIKQGNDITTSQDDLKVDKTVKDNEIKKPTTKSIAGVDDVSSINGNLKDNLNSIKKAGVASTLKEADSEHLENNNTPIDETVNNLMSISNEDFKSQFEDVNQIMAGIVGNPNEDKIISEIVKFTNKTALALKDIIKELNLIIDKNNKAYTKEEIKKNQQQFKKIQLKIEKIKQQYDLIKNNYDFIYFDSLENLQLSSVLKNYKLNADALSLESLAIKCKEQLTNVLIVVKLYEKQKEIDKNIEDKKEEITDRDNKYTIEKVRTNLINKKIEMISYELAKQQAYILEINKKVSDVTIEVQQKIKAISFTSLIGNMFKMAFGFLSLPFSKNNLFSGVLGMSLINSSIRNIRNSLTPSPETVIKYHFVNYEKQINNSKEYINNLSSLVNDSIEQVGFLKQEFKYEFEKYRYLIDDYDNLYNQILKIETMLYSKQKELENINEKINDIYNKNKIKVMKAVE